MLAVSVVRVLVLRRGVLGLRLVLVLRGLLGLPRVCCALQVVGPSGGGSVGWVLRP